MVSMGINVQEAFVTEFYPQQDGMLHVVFKGVVLGVERDPFAKLLTQVAKIVDKPVAQVRWFELFGRSGWGELVATWAGDTCTGVRWVPTKAAVAIGNCRVEEAPA